MRGRTMTASSCPRRLWLRAMVPSAGLLLLAALAGGCGGAGGGTPGAPDVLADAPSDAARADAPGLPDGASADAPPVGRDAAADDVTPKDTAGPPDAPAQDTAAPADAPAADTGAACSEAEECAAPLGCVDGRCAPCGSGGDCRASLGEGCVDAVCGPCDAAVQCVAPLGCRAAIGECAACRVASECRAGEACADGVCGPCVDASACDGLLCVDAACTPCEGAEGDALCAEQYDDAELACGEDGACAPATCTAGLDCWLSGRVCSVEGRCAPCADTYECLEAGSGGYAAGTVCVDGVCVEGDCLGSGDCPPERPICGAGARCRPCQSHAECLAREDVAEGFVCEQATGRCLAGDCYPAETACGDAAAQVCGDDYRCRACADDGECRVSLSADAAVCDGGACRLGCEDALGCTAGLVCGADHLCRGCEGDEECAAAYGAGRLCLDALCVAAECRTGADCAGGQRVCDANVCRACENDGECGAGRVCGAGFCVEGDCWPVAAACGPRDTQVCGADLACRICLFDGECRTSLDSDTAVCVDGACALGCEGTLGCEDGEVCSAEHRCRGCASDAECVSAYGDRYRCVAGLCFAAECLSNEECDAGQRICEAYACRGCVDHAECGLARVCADGTCLGGDCWPVGAACGGFGERVCGDDRVCRACAADLDCRSSLLAAHAVCDDGICSLGCTDALSCAEGEVCGADFRCAACSADAACTEQYGAAYLCLDGVCAEAECRTDADCDGGGRICEDGRCRDCASDAECGPDRVCGDGTCRDGDCWPAGSACGEELRGVCGADLLCGPCADDAACRAALASDAATCDAGECALGCEDTLGCPEGLVCGEDHRCRGCLGGADCAAAYSSTYLCVEQVCVEGDCITHADCLPDGRVCDPATNRCVLCASDLDCTGAHGAGFICLGSLCVAGDCHGDADCRGSREVCRENFCTECVSDTECKEAYADDTFVCEVDAPTGHRDCVQGCVRNDPCGVGGVCRDDNRCAPCTEDAACVAAYGAGRLCLEGACQQADCRVSQDCAGRLCTAEHRCVSCAGNAECVYGYGPDHICMLGTCLHAECTDSIHCAGTGWICDLDTFTCEACATDSGCKLAYGDAHYYCATAADPEETGTCALGCTANAACGMNQICSDSNRCQSCDTGNPAQDDARCRTAYGGNRLCEGGTCIPGNCRADTDCAADRLVCVDFLCTPCDRDNPCPAGQVCDANRCYWGTCAVSSQLVDCAQEGGGYRPCDAATHTCTACTAGTCAAGYVCDAGVCTPGNCLGHADCGGRVCDANACRPCLSHTDCREQLGDSIMRCDGGTCYHSFCVQDSDCGEYGPAPLNGHHVCREDSCGLNCNACDFACDPGYHREGDACAENNDPTVCGEPPVDCTLRYPLAALPPGAEVACGAGDCVVRCQAGRWDLNHDLAVLLDGNGCEYACTFVSAVDEPDGAMVDANCDGLDGEWDQAVFVAPNGDDAADGTHAAPVRTVRRGAVLAHVYGLAHVLVSAGTYPETLALTDGVSLHGGYDRNDATRAWRRSPSKVVTLAAPDTVGLLAVGIELPTTVSHLTITAASAADASGHSIGVLAVNCTEALVLDHVKVWAGAGADGADGSAGANGPDGGDGGPPAGGTCLYWTDGGSGGGGGASTCGAAGGRGGGVCFRYGCGLDYCYRWTCDFGQGPCGGPPGTCTGNHDATCAGADGAAVGANGAVGGVTMAATGLPVFAPGGTGGTGANGQSGSGGGCCESSGGAGGGAGGCAGLGGLGGRAGGASFGVYVACSSPTLSHCEVRAGSAGDGGAGAQGGQGGQGGLGALVAGRSGSDGGDGRPGGHGAGGNGGWSYALVRAGASAPQVIETALEAGTAGQGGYSPGHAGNAGAAGETRVLAHGGCDPAEALGQVGLTFVATARTWSAARDDCRSRGGDLAMATTSALDDAIRAAAAGAVVWIGASDLTTEGQWRWVDGSPLAWTHWKPGEPNNYGSGEDCGQMLADGTWNDAGCAAALPYACGPLPAFGVRCGDTACSTGETSVTCPQDCP